MNEQENPHRRSGTFMLVVAWLIVFGGVYWFFSGWNEAQVNPNQAPQVVNGELVLERNRGGHYVAPGSINGEAVSFLLDTGASQVALSSALANQLGLKRGPTVMVQTANGTVAGYQTRLESVRLGPIEVRNVAALVAPGLEADTVLLGMSFLKHLEFTQRGEQLTLRKL